MSVLAPSKDRCVVTIHRSSAARVLHYGEGFLREKLPEGTRVLYPPPPLQPVRDVKQAVRYAIAHPEGSEPLFALLKPGMKITIGLDDISIPLPPTPKPASEIAPSPNATAPTPPSAPPNLPRTSASVGGMARI